MPVVTYKLFAPLSNAGGHFRSLKLGAPFRVERWTKDKIVKLWRQLEWLPKHEIQYRVDSLYCVLEYARTGHVVTGEAIVDHGPGVDEMFRFHAELDRYAKRLQEKVRLLRLQLCAHVDVLGVFWYAPKERNKPEMISATTIAHDIKQLPGLVSSRMVPRLNNALANSRLPLKHDYIQLAWDHWDESLRTSASHFEFLSLVMSLEVLFNLGQHDVRYRVSRSLAVLLGKDEEQSEYIFEEAKKAYDLRSKLVHTGKATGLESFWRWHFRHTVRDAIVRLIEIDLPKEKVSDALTKLAFGQGELLRSRSPSFTQHVPPNKSLERTREK